MTISRRRLIAASIGATVVAVAGGWMVNSRQRYSSMISVESIDQKRLVMANGIPNHRYGDFPNPHDPIPVRPQHYRFEIPVKPTVAETPIPICMWRFGVALNGIPFDPSGPFWNGDARSGWQFEVLHPANAVALGLDCNHAHTQGRGSYHYHGVPTGLLWQRNIDNPQSPMQLLGYAADGFPIYGPQCTADSANLASRSIRLRSSYRLRRGMRKDGPKGRIDGTFVEDFEYVPCHGDLDECNGRIGPTPEYPDGTYYYVLTDEFPCVPRKWRGKPDESFRHGPPPGISPPVPGELRNYRGTS